jgi:ATP-binding cassette, subfamily B, bacterial
MMFHGGGGWWQYISHDPSKKKPQIDRQLLRRVLTYARPYWGLVTTVLVTILISSVIGLISPLLFRDLIDNVIPNRDFTRLNWVAVALIGLPILSELIGVLNRWASSRAGEGIIYDLRQQMYEHLQHMSIRFFTNTKAGEILSRLNNDVVGAQSAITGTLPGVITNLATLITTLAVMLSIEWRLTLLSVVVVPLFMLPTRRVANVLRDIRRQSMEYNSEMSTIVNETLGINGAMLVKIFGRKRQEINRYGSTNGKVRDIGVRQAMIGRWFFMAISLTAAIGTALVYWVGGRLVLEGAITVGTIVAFASYIFRLYGPISSLSNIQVEIAQSLVSFERVFEYLDLPIEIQDKADATELDKVEGRIRFEDVSFTYLSADQEPTPDVIPATDGSAFPNGNANPPTQLPSDPAEHRAPNGSPALSSAPPPLFPTSPIATISSRRWALHHVTFDTEPGQLIALVGPSGAGKTTITYLLPRLYDPTEGRITLDGHDLRDVTQESLAAQIGMVTQETYLFHDTVRANLMYAKQDATDAEIEAAARAANIYDFIMKLPNGFDTVVGERGYRFSGGEKQRIAIARVILKDPRILILDEATSHLDSQSEALIQAALEPLFKGRTSLVIAHRLSTILAADKILVFNEGQVVEQGTHDELMAKSGLYTDLYETQFRNPIPA